MHNGNIPNNHLSDRKRPRSYRAMKIALNDTASKGPLTFLPACPEAAYRGRLDAKNKKNKFPNVTEYNSIEFVFRSRHSVPLDNKTFL